MRALLVLLLIPAVFCQQCNPGAAQGPCNGTGTGGCATSFLCVNNECCPFANITAGTTSAATTTASCVDKINPKTGSSDCPNIAYLCNNPTYKAVMMDQCPLTCHFCGPSAAATTPSSCVDKINPNTGTSDCPNVAYLCTNPAYVELMKEQCPKTCGYCH